MVLAVVLFVIGLAAIAVVGRYGFGVGVESARPVVREPAADAQERETLPGSVVVLMARDNARSNKTPAIGEMRTWTDSGGLYTVEAELVDIKNGVVALRRKDGTWANLPFERLSEEDLEYLRPFVSDVRVEPTPAP